MRCHIICIHTHLLNLTHFTHSSSLSSLLFSPLGESKRLTNLYINIRGHTHTYTHTNSHTYSTLASWLISSLSSLPSSPLEGSKRLTNLYIIVRGHTHTRAHTQSRTYSTLELVTYLITLLPSLFFMTDPRDWQTCKTIFGSMPCTIISYANTHRQKLILT